MNSGYGNDSVAFAAFLALFLAVFFVTCLIALVGAYLLMAISLSQFFKKVGVESWIAWVPFYNYGKWLEVGGQPGWLAALLIVPYGNVVTAVFLAIGMYRTGIGFRKDGAWVVLGLFLPWLWCFLLARQSEVYEPGRILAAGYPAPLAGFGSVPKAPGAAPAG